MENQDVRDTLVINFTGAPGAGKSTAAAELFAIMKREYLSAELVTEFAKDLIYAGSAHRLNDQVYIFAEQHHRISRLMGKVDFIITDSPLYLSPFYAPKDYPAEFIGFVMAMARRYPSLNIFMERNHPYVTDGRLQTESEAQRISDDLENMMRRHGFDFIKRKSSLENAREIYDTIILPEVERRSLLPRARMCA